MRIILCLCLALLFALNVPAMVHAWEQGEGIHHVHDGEPEAASSGEAVPDAHDRAHAEHHCCATAHVMNRAEPLVLLEGPVLWHALRMRARLDDMFVSTALPPPTKPPLLSA